MRGRLGIAEPGKGNGSPLRRMVALSLAFHAAGIVIAQAAPRLFPSPPPPRAVIVELTDAPALPEPPEEPAPAIAPALRSADRVAPAAVPRERSEARAAAARRWIDRLDRALPGAPAPPPPARREASAERVARRTAARDEDFRQAAASEGRQELQRQLGELERSVRRAGPRPAAEPESEAVAMFAGTGPAGEPIPHHVREMIRKRVRERLPELESVYSAAMRRNPALQGKLVVRFRIDAAGKIVNAEAVGDAPSDAPFIAAILSRVRSWTFDPTAGIVVDVLYPFVFVAPS